MAQKPDSENEGKTLTWFGWGQGGGERVGFEFLWLRYGKWIGRRRVGVRAR